MRSMFCLMLLIPALIFAGNLQPVKVLPNEKPGNGKTPAATVNPHPPATVKFVVGRVDTIGGTTYDWQSNGPSYRWLVNAPGYGLHATWMFSAEPPPSWTDRNMRYNYYDFATGMWNFVEPGDFMASGVNVFTNRSGYGNVDFNPANGAAIISCHQSPGGAAIRPVLARDQETGQGLFEYCDGSPNTEGYLWPYIGYDGEVFHCALLDDATRDQLYYTKVATWCEWEPPVGIVAPQPDPGFPDQNIAVSKISGKICITWVQTPPSGFMDEPAYYRISTDGGTTWQDPVILEDPPAYTPPDTNPSFHIASLFPYFDSEDRLHIVCHVTPFVRDTNWILPAEVWHWCPDNNPNWSRIHRADAESLAGPVGSNASLACRASIGQDSRGRLYVAWEQFDPLNLEPQTELLRADIYMALSEDNGNTWLPAVKITEAGTASCRYPCVADRAVEQNGTILMPVIYMIDQMAGTVVLETPQGQPTNNPIVVHWVQAESLGAGVADLPKNNPTRVELSASPNPFSSRTVISYTVPRSGNVSLVLYDAAGRPIKNLVNGYREAGRYTLTLNGKELSAGIYFYTLSVDGTSLRRKLTVVR
ncbi:MAG: T9SS type A sorting domain-containing protein [candidate division WOR-3 bacterium]